MAVDLMEFAEPRREPVMPIEPEGVELLPHPADTTTEEDAPRTTRTKASDRAVGLAIESGAELWHDPEFAGFLSITKDGHRENFSIKSKAARMWLMGLFYHSERRGLSTQECNDALGLLEAMAIHEGQEHPVAVRVAHFKNTVLLDLGRPEWDAVEVTPEGWTIRPAHALSVRFRRPPGLQALPVPKAGGDLLRLGEVVNTDKEGIRLALAWLLFALGGSGPFPILALAGEQGTGKSTTARVLREIVDPNSVGLRTVPRDERDLAIAAQNAHILGFDNFSSIPEWLSDALCRLATGAGFATRTLWTDAEESLFSAKRPIILNGIPDLMNRGDLADRALALTLEPIREADRKPESAILQAVEAVKPDILGGLLDAVAVALRRLPGLKLDALPRMADFARFIVAAEPALPWKEGEFLATYAAAREDGARTLLEGDSIHGLMLEIVKAGNGSPPTPGTWVGTAAELLNALIATRPDGARPPAGWPKSAKGMGNHLRRIAPAMRQTGLEVEHSKGGGKKNARIITLRQAISKDGNGQSEQSEQSESHTIQGHSVRTVGAGNRPKQSDDSSVRTVAATVGRSADSTVRQENPYATRDTDGSDGSDDCSPSLGAVSGDTFVVDL